MKLLRFGILRGFKGNKCILEVKGFRPTITVDGGNNVLTQQDFGICFAISNETELHEIEDLYPTLSAKNQKIIDIVPMKELLGRQLMQE